MQPLPWGRPGSFPPLVRGRPLGSRFERCRWVSSDAQPGTFSDLGDGRKSLRATCSSSTSDLVVEHRGHPLGDRGQLFIERPDVAGGYLHRPSIRVIEMSLPPPSTHLPCREDSRASSTMAASPEMVPFRHARQIHGQRTPPRAALWRARRTTAGQASARAEPLCHFPPPAAPNRAEADMSQRA